jgi:transposase
LPRRFTMHKKYQVQLTSEQRQRLDGLIRSGNASARTQTHARILLKADGAAGSPAWSDAAIVTACEVSRPTVERVRRAFVTKGLEDALNRKRPAGPPRRKLDGTQEAQLIAVTCSAPPEGQERWTLALLADKLVELQVVDAIARETIRTTLKKTNVSHG